MAARNGGGRRQGGGARQGGGTRKRSAPKTNDMVNRKPSQKTRSVASAQRKTKKAVAARKTQSKASSRVQKQKANPAATARAHKAIAAGKGPLRTGKVTYHPSVLAAMKRSQKKK